MNIPKSLVIRYLRSDNTELLKAILHFSKHQSFDKFDTELSPRTLRVIKKAFNEEKHINFKIDRSNLKASLILRLLELETIKQQYKIKKDKIVDKGVFISLKTFSDAFECSRPFAKKLKQILKESGIVEIKNSYYNANGKNRKGSDKMYKKSRKKSQSQSEFPLKYQQNDNHYIINRIDSENIYASHTISHINKTEDKIIPKDSVIGKHLLEHRSEWTKIKEHNEA